MSPSMPTGAVLDSAEWAAVVDLRRRSGAWLINDAAMERLLFDGRTVIHPARYEGMRDRMITMGSAFKEYRMVGWRVGWVVGPAPIVADVARVSLANVVCQTGIAMGAVAGLEQQSMVVRREEVQDARPRIISDDGPQFVARDFETFIRLAGVTHVRTSPCYPQSNG